ncbi:MAG TPA: DoxX family protein [Candidatus Kapabacteria bacterium]|nr:DoxX family protein [Candidatus Kapabacteria bacterium]
MLQQSSRGSRLGRLLAAPFGTGLALTLLRLWVGIMLITHGTGKVMGGMERFTAGVTKLGFPAPEAFAWAAALSEFAGGIALVLGLGTRVACIFISCTMFVAAFMQNAGKPFSQQELAVTYLVLAVVIFIAGPGRYSIDAFLARSSGRT